MTDSYSETAGLEKKISDWEAQRGQWQGDGKFRMRDDDKHQLCLTVSYHETLGYQSSAQSTGSGSKLRQDLTFTGPWRAELAQAQADAERLGDYFIQFATELETGLIVRPRSAARQPRRGRSHVG